MNKTQQYIYHQDQDIKQYQHLRGLLCALSHSLIFKGNQSPDYKTISLMNINQNSKSNTAIFNNIIYHDQAGRISRNTE